MHCIRIIIQRYRGGLFIRLPFFFVLLSFTVTHFLFFFSTHPLFHAFTGYAACIHVRYLLFFLTYLASAFFFLLLLPSLHVFLDCLFFLWVSCVCVWCVLEREFPASSSDKACETYKWRNTSALSFVSLPLFFFRSARCYTHDHLECIVQLASFLTKEGARQSLSCTPLLSCFSGR